MTIEEILKQWLLTSTVEFPRRLGHIFPVVEGELLNMKELPDCGPEQYANGLIALFDAGMIQLSSADPTFDLETSTGISRTLDRLLNLKPADPAARIVRRVTRSSPKAKEEIVRDPALYVTFELTPLGGNVWENLAEADWAHFFQELSDYTAGEITSPDLTLIMARMGWFPELTGRHIQCESISIEELSNYQILYWKRLPKVYRASFSCQPADPRWKGECNVDPVWFRKWWWSTDAWYRQPWEFSGWPST